MRHTDRLRRTAAVLAVALLASCGPPSIPGPWAGASPGATVAGPGAASGSAAPTPTPVPAPGHELYGFVPYWEMDGTIAAHVAATPLTTLGLFSVTNTSKGTLNAGQPGFRRITGPVGSAMIAAAHGRGTRVELVFTSFGAKATTALFGSAALQAATARSLAGLVGRLGIDGVDVDVEGLDPGLVDAYGAFVGALRAALAEGAPGRTVSVATPAGPTGAAMAMAALAAGADRVFLMGYDYRTGSSAPGATAPIARADGGRSLTWSLDLYAAAGVPPGRLLLGLPLYGVSWPVAGPVADAPATGKGGPWVLRQHLDVLTDPRAVPQTDPLEGVDVYLLGSDGSMAPPSPGASPAPSPGVAWTAVFVDSPQTLSAKLGLGESRGLAGAGFWAIGYERGLPAFTALMERFAAGGVAAP